MNLNDMVDGTSWERIVCLEKEKNMDRRRKSRREQYAIKSQLDLHEVDLHEVVVESGYEVETLQSSVRLCTGLEIEVEHTKQKQRGRIVDYENRFKDYGVMSTGSASSREHFGRLHGNLQCIPTAAHILQIPNICPYCNAKKFQYESKGFCCADGKITLHSNDVPEDLYNLFTSSSEESLEFKKYIRTYNSNFAFTSFGVTYDKDLCKRNKGIYTFRIVGQVYHYINQILPLDSRPSYLQLYFYDTENELQYRLNISEKVRESILQRLMDILHVNPYAKFFRSLSGDPNLETYTLQIKSTPELDQRVFNAPSDSQVAIVWPEEDPSANLRTRDILVYCHSGTPYRVKYFFGCYDPLQYPLLFPFGECGWHEGIQRSNDTSNQFCGTNALIDANLAPSATELIRNETLVHEKKKRRSHVSCREYYCYKLQIEAKKNFWVRATARVLVQKTPFWFLACSICHRGSSVDNLGDIFLCRYCNSVSAITIARARAEVELKDSTGSIQASMIGEVAEKFFQCSAESIMMNNTSEDEAISHQMRMQTDEDHTFYLKATPSPTIPVDSAKGISAYHPASDFKLEILFIVELEPSQTSEPTPTYMNDESPVEKSTNPPTSVRSPSAKRALFQDPAEVNSSSKKIEKISEQDHVNTGKEKLL